MPELPEVETVRRGLIPALAGKRLARAEALRPDLRRPFPADLPSLAGRRIVAIDRRAKHLLLRIDDARTLMIHLGMSGRMTLSALPPNQLEPHDHLILAAEDGVTVRLNDPRRFGMVDLVAEADLPRHPSLALLGPEPLEDGFDGPELARRLAGRRTPLKAALLDQRLVAGLGNIYVCEALFEAGLSPLRLARDVTAAEAARLAAAVKAVLTRAIAAGGSSLRDHVQPNGELGYFQHEWAVYGREGAPCPGCDCGGGVARVAQSGRSTFYCARRQR